MSIYKTAYDTRVCSGAKLQKIQEGIRASLIMGDIQRDPGTGCYTIQSDATSLAQIPGFTHPMMVEISGEPEIFIDLRSYGKWSKQSDSFQVRGGSAADYRMALNRGAMNRVWITQSPSIMRDVSPMMTSVFTTWLSDAITKRFALEPREQMELAILAGLHFQYLFVEGGVADQMQEMRILATVAKAVRCSADDVKRVMNIIPEQFGDIGTFCKQAQEVTGSIRLKDFSPALLYTALGGSWFGPGAAELVGVALEHPPTWIIMLYIAVVERGFKNTGIAKIAERVNRQVSLDFQRSVVALSSLAAE